MLLAWASWVPLLIGLIYAFRGISNTKATGIAAVAGGFGEGMVVWGLGTMIVSQVIAITWLWRSFSREHISRNVLSVLSIGASLVMLLLVAGFIWVLWFGRLR